MTTPTRTPDDVRKAEFGAAPARPVERADLENRAGARPDKAAAPAAVPAWAKSAKVPKVVAWTPSGGVSKGAPPEPEPSERAPAPRTPGGRRVSVTTALGGPPGALATPPEATPQRGVPAVPEGMILISREELDEREADIRDEYRGPYLAAATRMRQAISELEQRLREDVVDLAGRIASVLMQRALQQDRTITLDIARRALRRLGPIERLVVKCAEEDAELLRERLPGMARSEMGQPVEILVRSSDDIQPGGLVLTFDGGVVDAREERRVARIIDAVKAAVRENDAILDSAREAGAVQTQGTEAPDDVHDEPRRPTAEDAEDAEGDAS